MKKNEVNDIISICDVKNDGGLNRSSDFVFEKENELEYRGKKVFDAYATYMKKIAKATNIEEKKKICANFLKAFNEFFEYEYHLEVSEEKVGPVFLDAMNYTVLSGGKRLRPALMFLTYLAFYGEDLYNIAIFLVAIEIAHNASLIHDDMPCMDNDELRRGMPSVWSKYGEDKALLLGDAMFMYTFQMLAKYLEDVTLFYHLKRNFLKNDHEKNHNHNGCDCDNEDYEDYLDVFTANTVCINIMHEAIGLNGMIQGQMDEILVQNKDKVSEKDILKVYDGKTAAIFKACFLVGKELSMDSNNIGNELRKLGECVGIAFQIKDDIEDMTKTTEELGKPAKSDLKNGKKTFILGKDEKTLMKQYKKYVDKSYDLLDKIGKKADIEIFGLKSFIEVMLEI